MNLIRVLDMTKLFKKEIMLYSIADIHFNTPKRLMFGVYFLILCVLWAVPLVYIFGFSFSPYTLMFYFGVPYGAAFFMSRPIWGGKSFFSWFKCMMKFAFSPKQFYDGRNVKTVGFNFVPHVYILISRTRDFQKLAKIEIEDRKRNES